MSVVIGSLRYLDGIAPSIHALGRRHAAYGVKPQHFDTVGSALLWTLAQGLGPAFTPEVESAWAAVYSLLSDTMQAGMADAALPRAA